MLLLRFCLSFFFLSLCLTIFFCLFYLSVRLSSFSTYPLLSFPFPPRNNYPSPCVLVLAWFSTSEIHPPLWKAHQLWWPRSRESPNIVAEIAPCGKKGCFSCACVRCSVSVHEWMADREVEIIFRYNNNCTAYQYIITVPPESDAIIVVNEGTEGRIPIMSFDGFHFENPLFLRPAFVSGQAKDHIFQSVVEGVRMAF